jgi:hypothetical protein
MQKLHNHIINPLNQMQMQTQLSTQLLDLLRKHPIAINGNPQIIALLAHHLNLIWELGYQEHTGDWDPYLIIELTDGTKLETHSGYPEIIFADFNDIEQKDALLHYQEINRIGFYIINPKDDEENPPIYYYALNAIKSIQILS